jgi:hypothetical protein
MDKNQIEHEDEDEDDHDRIRAAWSKTLRFIIWAK